MANTLNLLDFFVVIVSLVLTVWRPRRHGRPIRTPMLSPPRHGCRPVAEPPTPVVVAPPAP